MKQAVKIRSLPTFIENPFVDGVSGEKTKRTEMLYADGRVVMNPETGELEDTLGVARVKWVDSEQFVKVYLANLNVFFELGKAAQRVCEFAMAQVATRAINQGEVILSFPEYQDYFQGKQGGTRPTFMRGLQELAAKNLIAKSRTRDVWFINPAVMFNGDRARFVTEVRRRRKSQAEIAEEAGQMQLIPRDKKAGDAAT